MREIYKDPGRAPEERAADLVRRMTVREKVGQLNQRLFGFAAFRREGDDIRLTDRFCREVDRWGGLGVLYGLHRADTWTERDFASGLTGPLAVRARNMVQRYVIEHSRFGIPALITDECPHGPHLLDGYLLPVNLAAGCSFAPELLAEAAHVGGLQLRAMGVDMALVSVLDMLRDPRWGRSEECFGEDPFLTAAMGSAVIRGVQSAGVDAVAKHLCAQGETTGGVNASAARIGPRELREIHLPPVEACVRAGAAAFMAAYNEIDGVPCHANRWLLTDLLRGEYGFTGFVMADGCAVDRLDGITGDKTVSGALALNAGVDVSLWDECFPRLEEALDRGLISAQRLDQAVCRVLEAKFRRGLFDEPYLSESESWRQYTPAAFPQVKTLAEHTPVLLKNRGGLLPLDKNRPLRVGLTGPNADSVYNQLGDYTPPVRREACVTLRRGLETLLAEGAAELIWLDSGGVFDPAPDRAAIDAFAARCDVIIAAVGGTSSRFEGGSFGDNGAMEEQAELTMDCGENVDDDELRLPGGQLALLEALRASGRSVVTVLIAGRPYAMEDIDRCSDAIFCAFYPGLTGGEALAKLLFGLCEPAGRLCVSLPDRAGQLPVYYDHKASYQAMTYYNSGPPRYGFGRGMGYTTFAYALAAGPEGEARQVRFDVTNTGSRPGWAVPQLYIRRLQGVVTARASQLCGFAKRLLAPGETIRLIIPIPRESLEQWDLSMERRLVPGRIAWSVCDGGEKLLEGEFEV